ncbi:MAG: 4Fe-4S dicluster domain-containing protein [Candidatus Altiarchaeota archaeon]
MNALTQSLKHIICGAHNVPKILLGTGRLTDKGIRKTILSGKVKYPDTVDVDLCMGCGVCSRICPVKCITMKPLPEKVKLREGQYKEKYPEIDHEKCMFCFQCHDTCPMYVAHRQQAAIHPRGVRKSGVKAWELFKDMDEKAKGGG